MCEDQHDTVMQSYPVRCKRIEVIGFMQPFAQFCAIVENAVMKQGSTAWLQCKDGKHGFTQRYDVLRLRNTHCKSVRCWINTHSSAKPQHNICTAAFSRKQQQGVAFLQSNTWREVLAVTSYNWEPRKPQASNLVGGVKVDRPIRRKVFNDS